MLLPLLWWAAMDVLYYYFRLNLYTPLTNCKAILSFRQIFAFSGFALLTLRKIRSNQTKQRFVMVLVLA